MTKYVVFLLIACFALFLWYQWYTQEPDLIYQDTKIERSFPIVPDRIDNPWPAEAGKDKG